MFTQPSVNQIASAYQGNPAPLAQKVNKDKKQNGGIPQDLRQLLALNDITQGRNAMGIQQALQTPTNMPTVAQDLQERARQAMQARQMQAMQEMQRKNGQPGIVPPGTPRPPMQAQGLDSLESNVGEGYANGGIIGHTQHFDGVHGSAVKDPKQKEKEERALAEQRESDRRDLLAIPAALLDVLQLPVAAGYNLAADTGSAIESGLNRLGSAITGENINTQSDNQVGGKFRFSPTPFTDKLRQPTEREAKVAEQERQSQTVAATNPATIRSQLNAADAMSRSQPGTPPPPRANTGTQTRVNLDNAPMPGGLKDLVSTQATPGGDYQRKMLGQDEEALAAAKRAAYLKEVGNRDLSVYDQMAQELKARKERLNAPKPGYDAMMEYLGQIAQGGGRTWMEAGSRGAANQNALQKQRLAEQDLLMDKILDIGAKKTEAQYAEKKSLFELTQAEKDRVIKDKLEVAKQLNLSEDKTRELIQQSLENELNRKNQIRAAQIGAQDRDNLMSRARALMAADPTKKMTLEQAMQRAGEIGSAGQMESAEVRKLKAFDDAVKNLNSEAKYMSMLLDKKNKPENAALRAEYANEIKKLENRYGVSGQGINSLPTSTGLPAGVTVTQVR